MYTPKYLAQVCDATLAGNKRLQQQATVAHLIYDSRRPAPQVDRAIFIALRNANVDGHRYIEAAYDAGVRCFLVEKNNYFYNNIDKKIIKDSVFIVVNNTLAALQAIVRAHRLHFDALRTIGITGSNGKTIVKEWLYHLLCADFSIVRSPKSYNSQLGVPLSVWAINTDHNLAIFEAGVSQTGEMAHLEAIIKPNIGIFTNLGTAHSEGFPDELAKAKEKAILFKDADTVIFCLDNTAIKTAIDALHLPNHFTWSRSDTTANLCIIATQKNSLATTIQAVYNEQEISITIPFTDDASIENAITCWTTMLYIAYDAELIATRMETLEAVALRLELRVGINGCTVINDSYSSDMDSLRIALDFVRQQHTADRRLTVVLSDILQSGKTPETLYKAVAELLATQPLIRVIGIGSEIGALAKYFNKKNKQKQFFSFATTDDFLSAWAEIPFLSETILLKGARKFAFERIAERLILKQHRTTLEVNLTALSHNFRLYRSLLLPTTKLMVMVKAAAYGSGSDRVARLLEFEKADYLAVAYTDEGVELRKIGIKTPIMVMNIEENSLDNLIRYGLEPEIFSRNTLAQFLNHLRRFPEHKSYPIHLKMDTGMRRLGFEADDMDWLVDYPKQQNIQIVSIFTHLVATDNPLHDAFTHEQVQKFEAMYERLAAAIGYRPLRHVLNSGGITRFGGYQMDMVRLGIGLYGIDSGAVLQSRLQTVLALKATVSQIKNVAAGESVGYNRMRFAEKAMRIATISIGYADGFGRQLSNGRGAVLLHGQLAPVVGNVCMDMTMIDVTDIAAAQEGSEVEVFGAQYAVQNIAAALSSIPYEVFTNVSERVKRVYFQE